ncbi:uncharacterized protein (TIGR02099 family) [Marinomonas alcarazii]|uniref:Uncharacterized protein (TIGR02099 family) n=1 Tax=Marinomonas alcarazii TaxID=491949 RepID=A0A318V299_9GAMM|nr:YhdP family protein [Marinomonas alcarazii]PYF82996.1 uncharacterized protein (TIGR02099 family) [Marinomonas alcarazii]
MRWVLRKLILFSFWAAVVLTALLAIFAVSVGQLLPYMDRYRPQIENNLQQIIGYPVTLERIDGGLEGVDPTVSISGFNILANGKASVRVDEMRIRLDTVKSLLSLSPQFTYIRFVRPYVQMQENKGVWHLAGATSRNVRNDVGVERALDYLSAQKNFSIYDGQIDINSEQLGEHKVRFPHLYLFQKSFESLLTSKIFLDDYQSPFVLNARIAQTRGLLGDYRVKASLVAPKISLPIDSVLANNAYSIASADFAGELWLDAVVGKEYEVRAESTNVNIGFEDGRNFDATSSVKLHYSQRQPAIRLDLKDLVISDSSDVSYPAIDAVFDWSSLTDRSTVRFNQADLGLGHEILAHFLPKDSNAFSILNGLHPLGVAKNGSVQVWREDGELSFEFLSNLQAASVNAYNGIPQADKINAVFSLSEDSGYIDFRGNDSKLWFDTVYESPWQVDKVLGYVSWQKQQDIFLVSGRDLLVQRRGADVNGGFRLEVRSDEPDWLALDLHGQNLSVADRLDYIPPKVLDEAVMSWIQKAFPNSGEITDVDVLVQSELSDGAKPHVRMQMGLNDTDVAFDENWPTATDVKGNFSYDATGISVHVDSAKLADLPVSNLLVTVPIINEKADWLNISGAVDEEAPLVISTLQSTPLADSVLSPFANWQLEGRVKGKFDVAVPFVPDTEPKVQLALDFKNNPLRINDLDLAGYVQEGRLNYSSSEGITDSAFDIQALGGKSHLTLSSKATGEAGGLAVIGDFSGEVDIKDVLKWRDVSDLAINRASGLTGYAGKLLVNQSQMGQVDFTIDSELVGVKIDLPEPIGKESDETKPLQVKVRQHESDLVIDASYDSLAKARMLLQRNEFIGGELIVSTVQGEEFSSTIPNGLVISGNLKQLLVPEWQSVMADFSGGSTQTDADDIPALPAWLSRVDLIVDRVVVNPNNTWHNFKVAYNASTNKPLFVNSDEMNFAFIKKDGVINLNFGFLSWNSDPSEEAGSSKEAPFSARQIPNMKLSVDQLYFNEKPYGDWQLNITREGDVLRVDPISSKLKTGHFTGSLFWQDRGESSSVELVVAADGADLAELTQKFSNKPIVTSKKYKIDVGLSWKGHPFYFDRESVSGRIAFSSSNGNFSQVDELPPFLKVLGIFNVGALSRRLLLDFSDVYEPGLTYDDFNGVLSLSNGILKTISPITIKSPTAELVVAGEADIVNEKLNERLTATFPISGTLPLAGLIWGTPQLAGLLFITDKLIGDQLSKVTSVQYKVEGSFNDPVITPVRYQPVGKSNDK